MAFAFALVCLALNFDGALSEALIGHEHIGIELALRFRATGIEFAESNSTRI